MKNADKTVRVTPHMFAVTFMGYCILKRAPQPPKGILMKIIKICMIIGFTLLATTACRQTMRGAGEDIEKAGEKIQDSVE